MRTAPATEPTGGWEWTPPALTRFLDALAHSIRARAACFLAPDGTLMTSGDLAEDERTALRSTAARQTDVLPSRVTLGSLVIDRASVCTSQDITVGTLLIVRAHEDATAPAVAAAEVRLAAALAPSALFTPSLAATREGLLEWASATAGGRTAFAITIDRIAAVHDVVGYVAGESVLRELAARIERWAGPAGRAAPAGVARYLVIRGDVTDEATARREADRLRADLAAPVQVRDSPDELASATISRSASVGVLVDADGSTSAEDLLLGAVRSAALARSAGGDQIVLYDAASTRHRLDRLHLELELDEAVDGKQLRMHYQPEFDLRSGQVVAIEGLLRWQHPRRGLLGAQAFVPATERTHTFSAVQEWIVNEACNQLGRWQAAGVGAGVILRINVSAPQLLSGDLTTVLDAALARNGLSGDRVCMEITERSIPADVAALATVLEGWRARGITVAVDDFGTGEGTLTHLLDLPVDVLKIDQAFVSTMDRDQRSAVIVAHVVELARGLRLDVVAEGIASPEVAQRLVQLGCQRGQGNFLAPAMPADEVVALLARN